MIQIKQIIPLAAAAMIFCLTACEKVIDIELDESEQQTVIEARLSEGTNDFSVIISKTAPYFENAPSERIDNAVVTLNDDSGEGALVIPHQQNGVYTAQVTAVAGRTYTLQAEIDGQTYTALSFLPEKVELTELYTEFRSAMGPNDAGYLLYFRYDDPPGVSNFYRVLHSVNGVLQNEGDDLQVVNDELNDGSTARFPLFRKIFQAEDTVQVVLQHFDEASYDYFNSLSDIISGGAGFAGGSVAPGNPVSNWNDDVLGYFSAVNPDTLSIIITE